MGGSESNIVQLCGRIRDTPVFNNLVTAVILLAGVVVGLETYPGLASEYGGLLTFINQAIMAIFVLEIAIKMVAEGRSPGNFFKDPWNTFDFIIVAASLIPSGMPVQVLRLVRLVRVLRLVRALPNLQILVNAMMKSMKSIAYVGLLLTLMLYVYAVAGVFLFGGIDPVNFGSLGAAFVSLIQAVTLEPWLDFFATSYAVMPATALIYWISFVLIDAMIILNLFVGVVISSMEEAKIEAREEAAGTTDSTIDDQLVVLQQQIRDLHDQATMVVRTIRNEEHPDGAEPSLGPGASPGVAG